MLFHLVNVIDTQQTPVELLEDSQAVNISSDDAAYHLLACQQKCLLATLVKKWEKPTKRVVTKSLSHNFRCAFGLCFKTWSVPGSRDLA